MINIIIWAALALFFCVVAATGLKRLISMLSNKHQVIEFELGGITKRERRDEAIKSIRHGLYLLRENRGLK